MNKITLKELRRRKENLLKEIQELELKKNKIEKEIANFSNNLSKVEPSIEKIKKEYENIKFELEETIKALNFVRQAFASSGGKFRVAKKIASLIPEHEIYVEPFAGGASVFFAKKPSKVEVLNDKDPEVAFAYKFMQSMSEDDLKKLKSMKWEADKEHFYKIVKMKPRTDLERFYKFAYIRRFSYGAKGAGAGYGGTPGEKSTLVERLPEIQKRLKGVKIFNTDYKEVIKKFDSPQTFFYLDPPYPDTTIAADWKEKCLYFSEDDLKELAGILKNLKGKFILSLNKKYENIFSDFKKSKIRTSNLMNLGFNPRYEYIIYNFDLKEKIDYIHDVYNYNPREMTNEQLADDWRIVLAWWCSKKQGKKIPYSFEDIANLAHIIYNEIVYRVKRGEMKHTFEPEKMTPCARELYKKIAKISFSEKKSYIEFLGTGPDVPILDKKGKSKRLNSSILINDSILVDATPQVEMQLKNKKIDAVIITHAHEDAILGLPKLKQFSKTELLPVYAFKHTIEIIKNKFKKLDFVIFRPVEEYKEFTINGITILPIPVKHSVIHPKFDPLMALKIDTLIYAEDIDQDYLFSNEAKRFLEFVRAAEYLIIDGALCKGKMPGHCNIFDVLNFFKEKQIDTKIIFTQIGHNCPKHEDLVKLVKKINKNADVAYDGMKIKFETLNFLKINAIYLKNAEDMWNGKDVLIKDKEYYSLIGLPSYIVDDKFCYGLGILSEPVLVEKNEFREYAKKYGIPLSEFEDKNYVYIYNIDWINKFTQPLKIKHRKIPEFDNVSFEFINFEDLSFEELVDVAKSILQFNRESSILDVILMEIKKRGKVREFVLELLRDFSVIHGFISLIGSTAEKGAGNDIDFLIRMSEPSDFLKRAIETRIRKMLPENIDDYIPLHFVWGDEAGAHDTYIPLYDLTLKRTKQERIEMSKNKVQLFKPYLPQKPKGSAFYNIDDLLDKIFGDQDE